MSPSDPPRMDDMDDDIIPDPSEALEFEPVLRSRPKRRIGVLLALLILAGGGAGAGWYYYGDMVMVGTDGEAPVIRAADGPVKVRPENPGGMAIPNRDKLIYERLKGADQEFRVERLLPPPETPLAPPAPKAKVASPATPAVVKKPVAKPIVDPASIPRIEAPVKAAPARTPSAVTAKSSMVYRIQLAAVRSKEAAISEWGRLKKKNGDLLGGLNLDVIKVDLGAGKGVFYRLRAGPLKNEATAKKLCEQLSSRKIGCLIVRPEGL